MPKATVSLETVRRDLRACPGGYVVLRTPSYAEMLHRRDIMSKMSYDQRVKAKKRGASDQDVLKVALETMQSVAAEYEFANFIVDHNLEDEQGRKLDFSIPMTLKSLDPRIGEEIGSLIDELTRESDEDFPEDSDNAATSSSSSGSMLPNDDSE